MKKRTLPSTSLLPPVGASLMSCGLKVFALVLLASSAHAAITGTVFRDFNGNGTKEASNPTEPGVAGVVVTAFDSTGVSSGTATSAANGSYSITATGTAPYRVEFTLSPSGICATSGIEFSSGGGSSYGTSVQFVASGTAANVNFAVHNPSDFNQGTSGISAFIPCYVSGDPLPSGSAAGAEAWFVGYPYTNSGTTVKPPQMIGGSIIGPTWGVAYSKKAGKVFTSAMLKRHVGLGALGSGGIYLLTPTATSFTVDSFYDMDANGHRTRADGAAPAYGEGTSFSIAADNATITYLGTNDPLTGKPSGLGVIGTNTQRGLVTNPVTPSHDPAAFDQVGKVGLGDIDISDDGKFLFVMNLYSRKVFRLELDNASNPTAAANVTSYDFPAITCTNGEYRPWGLKFFRDKLYVGVVCSAENAGTAANLTASVYQLNNPTAAATFNPSAVLTLPLNYNKVGDHKPWTNNSNSIGSNTIYPQPMLSDIEFTDNGDMLLGIMDRAGHQWGEKNRKFLKSTTTSITVSTSGDLLIAGLNCASGTFTLENNGTVTSGNGLLLTGSANTDAGPGGKEFFNDNGPLGGFHDETAIGSLAVLKGQGELFLSSYDSTANSGDAGTIKLSTSNGSYVAGSSYELYNRTSGDGVFAKANGLGDLEITSPEAPIEIGNRVWVDTDGDGIQDADEAAISGAVVTLKNAAGSTISSATTDTNGNYFFTNGAGTSTPSTKYGLTGLTVSTAGYQLCISKTDSALAGKSATAANADSTANGDERDSDGVNSGANIVITFATGPAGANVHSYDFGFTSATPPAVTVPPPAIVCSDPNPTLILPCFVQGDLASLDVLVRFPLANAAEKDGNISGSFPGGPAPEHLATNGEMGAIYGLAVDQNTGAAYVSAYMKRKTTFGPGGTGAIYKVTNAVSGTPSTVLFVDINAVFGAGTAGSDPHTLPYINDDSSIPHIGKVAFGDIDLSADGSTLYAVSLADRRLYIIPTTGPLNTSTIQRLDIPTSLPNCPAADMRPFGLGIDGNGKVYVGAVCSAESTNNRNNLRAFAWRLDGSTFTLVMDQPLNYQREGGWNGLDWNPWGTQDDVGSLPSPMLSDLEFDGTGMLLGLRDRYGDQTPANGKQADEAPYPRGFGDTLRTCISGGMFVLESGAACGGSATAGAGNGDGPGNGEYFFQDESGDNSIESANGSLVYLPSGEVITTAYDSVNRNNDGSPITTNYNAGGIQRFSLTTGEYLGAYDIYRQASSTFAKANGVGDLEIGCALPVQPVLALGNAVWKDTNNDGNYDSGEGAAGVVVELWNATTNTEVATGPDGDPSTAADNAADLATDSNGCYLFKNLPAGTYYVKIPANEFATGEPLNGFISITGTQTGDDDAGEDGIDDSAIVANGIRSADVVLADNGAPTGEAGKDSSNAANVADDNNTDLTVDLGFITPCAITAISMTGGTATCNDNGTPSITTDDYYTSDVTVSFANKPATGNLVLSGAALHSSNTVSTVAVGSTTSATLHVFSGVRLKANNTANALTTTFSADTVCTLTQNTAAVPPCSECPSISVTPNPLSSGTVGTAYSASPSASGGTAPYTWTTANLPAGLGIDPSSGVISGTPTSTGTATITATDSNGCTGTTTLSINPFACPVITVTPNLLSPGSIGQAYSQTPTASGAGTGATYTWSATTLPIGLAIDPATGAVTGTPTAEGTATITATFTGPGGEACTGTATLSVTNTCCPQITISIP